MGQLSNKSDGYGTLLSCIEIFPQTAPENQPISGGVGTLETEKVQEKDRQRILLDPPCCTVVPKHTQLNTNNLFGLTH